MERQPRRGHTISSAQTTVFHIIYSLTQGGAETLLLELARHCGGSSPYRAVVCAWHGEGALRRHFVEAGIEVIALPKTIHTIRRGPLALLDFLRVMAAIRAHARKHNARIVHGHMSDGNLIAALLGRLTRLPSIASVYSNHLLPMPIQRSVLKQASWRLASFVAHRLASRTTVLSDEMRDTVVRQFAAPVERIRITPAGVEAPRITVRRAEARAHLDLADDALVLLFVGRLVASKNQAALIHMMRHVREWHPTAILLLVGQGPDHESLAAQVAALGLLPAVRLIGHAPDLDDFIASADLFVSASVSEGVSIAVLEAMASGLPVVAVACEGNATTLDAGAGKLVPTADPRALAVAVSELASNAAERERLTRCARERFESRHASDNMTRAMFGVYTEALAGGRT